LRDKGIFGGRGESQTHTLEVGKVLTRLLGNYLTEALGKVLDIYIRTWKSSSFRRRETGSPSIPVAPITKMVFCMIITSLMLFIKSKPMSANVLSIYDVATEGSKLGSSECNEASQVPACYMTEPKARQGNRRFPRSCSPIIQSFSDDLWKESSSYLPIV